MAKRLKFKCWNCPKTYTLLRETKDQQKLFVACPYCNAEAVVDLTPYPKKPISILKNLSSGLEQSLLGSELDLPETLPTQKPE
jgi:DNA-directed RNA polymerase subunit RPC12/RpoP